MRFLASGLPILLFAAHLALAAAESTLLSLAPPSSTVLSGIDVQRAVASRSGNAIVQQTIEGQGLTKLLAAVGLDVRRNVTQILLIGTGQRLNAESRYALLARGTYNPARLIAAAKSHGASISRYGAVTVASLGTGDAQSAIAFLRPGVLALGNVANVRTVLASGARAGGIDPTLRDQVDRISPGNDVWYATSLSGSFLARQVGDALPPALGNSEVLDRISRSSGGLQFGTSDKVTLDLVARSPGDARLLSDALRLAGRLARFDFSGSANLVLAENVLSSMRVEVEGSLIHATSTVPDEQLQRALSSPK